MKFFCQISSRYNFYKLGEGTLRWDILWAFEDKLGISDHIFSKQFLHSTNAFHYITVSLALFVSAIKHPWSALNSSVLKY